MLLLLFPRITRSFRSLLIDSVFGCSFIRLLSLAPAFLSSGDQLTLGNNLRLECAFTVPARLRFETAAAHSPYGLSALAVTAFGHTGGVCIIRTVLKLAFPP